MYCKYSHSDGEGRFECDVSGDGCMFLIPDSRLCAVLYGEGPDADNLDEIEMHCNSCYAEFMADRLSNDHRCPECGSEEVALGNYDPSQDRARETDDDDLDEEEDWDDNDVSGPDADLLF